MNFVLIFLGGGAGALSRYLLSKFISENFNHIFPLGTLIINLSGCFIIGFLYGFFDKYIIPPDIRLLIFVGFLGGFTTFSSFGLETLNLLKNSEINFAIINVLISNIAGLILVYIGTILSGLLTKKI